MQNAHERFGTLEFTKRVKDTTTRVRVYMDRLIVEVGKEENRSAGVHLLSMMGSDAEIAALWAGVTEGAFFQIQVPGRSVFTGSLAPEAQCFRGSAHGPFWAMTIRCLCSIGSPRDMAFRWFPSGRRGLCASLISGRRFAL